MMRTVDILYSLPFIFFVIILMVYFGETSSTFSSPSAVPVATMPDRTGGC